MQTYIQMALTVLLSLLGSTMLKLSHGFTVITPTLIFIVSYCLAFYFWFYNKCWGSDYPDIYFFRKNNKKREQK